MHYWKKYQYIVSSLNLIIPFSMMEVLAIHLFGGIIVLLVFMIKNFIDRKPVKAINNIFIILNIISLTAFNYYITAGIAYNRHYVNINLYEENVNKSDFYEIVNYFLDDFNYCASTLDFKENGDIKEIYTLSELNKLYKDEFSKLDNNYFFKYTPNAKYLASSFLYRELHIVGVSFSLTGEPNINYLNDVSDIPFTYAHEMAHAKGVMNEDQANLVSLYINLSSSNEYFRYSAYSRCFSSLLLLLKLTNKDLYIDAYERLNENIKKNWEYSNNYWNQFKLFEEIGDFINDLYLKINGSIGIDSYKDVTKVDEITDDDGSISYEIKEFSPYQKLFFDFYYNDLIN